MTLLRRSKKQLELLGLIRQSRPMCIYELAKLAGRPYRRVHDQVKRLAEQGQVALEPAVRTNRKVVMVVPTDHYHARLRRLDDMYAAYKELTR